MSGYVLRFTLYDLRITQDAKNSGKFLN